LKPQTLKRRTVPPAEYPATFLKHAQRFLRTLEIHNQNPLQTSCAGRSSAPTHVAAPGADTR